MPDMSRALTSYDWLDTSFDSCRGPLIGSQAGGKQHSPDVPPSNHPAGSPHSSTEHQTTLQGCSHHLLSACASTERCRDLPQCGTASPPDASATGALARAGSCEVSQETDMVMLHEAAGMGSSAAAGSVYPDHSTSSSRDGGAIQPGWGMGTLGAQLLGPQDGLQLVPLFGMPSSSSSMPATSQQQQQQAGPGAGQAMQMGGGQWQPCSSPAQTAVQQQQQQPLEPSTLMQDMDFLSNWFEEPAAAPNAQQQQLEQQHQQMEQQQRQQQQMEHQHQQDHNQLPQVVPQVMQQQHQQQQSVPISQPWGAGATGSWQGAVSSAPACMPMVSGGMPLSSPSPVGGAGGGMCGTTHHHSSMASPQQAPMAGPHGMTSSNMANGAGEQQTGGNGDSSYQEWLCSIAAAHPLLARVADTPSAAPLSPPTSSSMGGAGSPAAGSGSSGSPGGPTGLVGPLVGLLTGQGRQLPPLQLAAAERALHQHLEKAYQAGYLDGYSHGQSAGRATAAAAAAAAAGGGYMPPRPLSAGGGHTPVPHGSYRPPPVHVAWPPPSCHPPRHPPALGCLPPFGASAASSYPLGKRGGPHLELQRKRVTLNKPPSTAGGSSHGGQRSVVPPRGGTPGTPALPPQHPPAMELLPQGSGGLKMYPPLASGLPSPAFGAGFGAPHPAAGSRRAVAGSRPQRPPAHAPVGASQVEQLREVATAAAKAALQGPPTPGPTLDREAAAACLSTLSTEELLAMASRVAAASTAGVLPVVPELNVLSQGCSSR